jgi:hypothetical protein
MALPGPWKPRHGMGGLRRFGSPLRVEPGGRLDGSQNGDMVNRERAARPGVIAPDGDGAPFSLDV